MFLTQKRNQSMKGLFYLCCPCTLYSNHSSFYYLHIFHSRHSFSRMQERQGSPRQGNASELLGFFYSPVNTDLRPVRRISKSKQHHRRDIEFALTKWKNDKMRHV